MVSRWLSVSFVVALGLAAVVANQAARASYSGPPPANPAPIACGAPYTVVRGDTLRDITIRAYGHDDWNVLMAANRGTIRRAENLEIGWQLAIPCPEGGAPAPAPAAMAPAAPEPVAEAPAAVTSSPACGQSYTVVRGDTLRSISRRFFGNDDIRPILNANRGVIWNPNLLEVGWVLEIPCSAGAPARAAAAPTPTPAPAAAPAAEAAAPSMPAGVRAPTPPAPGPAPATPGAAPAAPAADPLGDAKEGEAAAFPCAPVPAQPCSEVLPPYSHTLRFLTGGDYAPFAGAELDQGGMITELAARAMAIADPGRTFRIDHVNDWNAHLTVLMPTGVFDLGFPWFKPDCTKEFLSADMRLRCTDYDFSHPVYEVVVGYYVRAADTGLVQARARTLLSGLTLCRPRGLFTFDLEQEGLMEPAVTLMQPERPDDCFRMLAAGEVDVVTLPVPAAEAAINDLMLAGRVVEASDLATIQTMHVIAHKSNPFGRPYLTLINRGLRQMQESGEWFEIVSRHLANNARLN